MSEWTHYIQFATTIGLIGLVGILVLIRLGKIQDLLERDE